MGLRAMKLIPRLKVSVFVALGLMLIDKMSGTSKLVCVCNATSCDDIDFEWPQSPDEAYLIQTTKSGLRFKVSHLDSVQNGNDTGIRELHVNLKGEHQTILGWGGAFTDAATINIRSLSEGTAKKLLESYYGHDGLRYNFGRVPIAGSDFSTRAYTYDDSEQPDYGLTKWSLAQEDLDYKIPVIKDALKIASGIGTALKLFASSWSPPAWMKTNHKLVRGQLINDEKVYRSYAEYLMKFFAAYKEHGIEFWGATVQNEPVASDLPLYFFNSLQFGAEQQALFISNYLGPAMEANGMTRDNFKLMVGDDSLGFVNRHVVKLLSKPEVLKYVSGFAFHWYTSGVVVPYNQLTQIYESVKNKIEFMMMSEACTGSMPWSRKVDLGAWDRGVAYAQDIIEDLSRNTAAWIDWNMALDVNGGPNWAKNFVDSPIIVNGQKDEFYKQPMYYVLAHFTRLFRPGSIRVDSSVISKGLHLTRNPQHIAVYDKQSGHAIVNILNDANNSVKLNVIFEKPDGSILRLKRFSLPEKSIGSIVIKI